MKINTMKMNKLKIKNACAAAVLLMFGMAGLTTLGAQAVPVWVNELEKAFPSKDWVAVVAQGTSQPQAENAAMNALARAFKTDVASLTQASQKFSQIVNDAAGKKTVSFDESKSFSQDVNTSTNVQGLIFYDKGNNTGGWRYLEAAPADINRELKATSESINSNDCAERAVGKGKSNTAAIMKEAANKGGGFGWAAQACDAYTLNGFSDWFLPSRDELHYVYGNLHMNGLGNFRDDWYWTSTAYGAHTTQVNFWLENFSNGSQDYGTNPHRVRPIRQF